MRKQFSIVLMMVLCAGFGVFAWVELHQSEPSYQGRSLRVWLQAYSEGKSTPDWLHSQQVQQQLQQQSNAIAQIGTNAIPVLLSMLQVKDSVVRSNLICLLRRQTFIRVHPHTDREYHSIALNGFEALGPIGKPAVPVLIHLLEDPELRRNAAFSLGRIGPASVDAVPILISWLTNTEVATRYCAVDALGRIGPAARKAQPALLEHTNDANRFVRTAIELALGRQKAYPDILIPKLIQELEADLAANRFEPAKVQALGAFGVQAKSAVPILLQLLSKHFAETQEIADALKQIDPETAASADLLARQLRTKIVR
jgi:flagellar basal body-associated protein FliL